MMITFVLGGSRSGKSLFALEKSSAFSGKKAFIATAQALDEEMKERIERHKKERSIEWVTFEEPLDISGSINKLGSDFNAALIDCLTLWLSNIMLNNLNIKEQIDSFCGSIASVKYPLFIVSNEVGMGIVPENDLSRKFRDNAGFLNRRIASIADEVYLVTAGIPLKIK
jgi:adenosylcobinamide kinase/adenosylcobinamide-phosphate guanylyltransferase